MNKKFKMRLYATLASIMAISSVNIAYASTILVNDNFNQMTLGQAPTGYQSSQGVYIVDLNNNQDYSVYLEDNAGQLKLNKPLSIQTDILTTSVDFMQQQLGSGTAINLTMANGLRAIRLETRNNGTALTYFNGTDYIKVADITANEWITIKIVADIPNQSADIYINGVQQLKDVPFENEVTSIAYFQTLTPMDKVAGHYIDNLNISIGKPSPVIPDDATEIKLTVDQNGTGDFTTVQEAIDFLAAQKKLPSTINIKAGTYKEVVTIPKSVSNLSLIGEGAENTILTFDNYSSKLKEDGTTYGTGGSSSTFIKGSDISIEDITFENSFEETGADGEQAVALQATGERIQFKNCRFIGNQDTLLLDGGTQYFTDCYIEGDVDFIFGRSQAVFNNCEIHSLDRGSKSNNGYIVAPRTSINESYGFLFENCKLTAEKGTANDSVYLGRPWCPSGTSVDKPSTLFKNTEMGAHIKNNPWTSMSGVPASHGRFFEYGNTGAGAVQNENRPQLTKEEAAEWTTTSVLNGWEPSFSKTELPPTEVLPPVVEKIYFTDVTSTDAYYEDIMFLANNGYVAGIGNGLFAPLQEMTRSQFATIMSNILDISATSTTSSFTDVRTDAWYFNSIQACYEAGLIKGVSETKFAPNDKITKQDMMVLLSRVITYLDIDTNVIDAKLAFIDSDAISAYAKGGVELCIGAGILKNEGYFIPKNMVTRADMATMFTKIINLDTSK